jgi:HK97 gp10 family phage protein
VELNMTVTGLEELRAKLRQLPDKIGNRALRRALRRGGNVIRDRVRENARGVDDPQTADMIHKNVAVVAGGQKRERMVGGPMVRVGVRGGARPLKKGTVTGLPGGNTTHWRLVEFGTSDTSAQPFMRPAVANPGPVLDVVIQAMPREIDKELAKLGRR